MSDEMGYQACMKTGPFGLTEQVTQAKDVAYSLQLQRGPTTVRGTGASVPITTSNATQRTPTVTWTMQNDPTDSVLAAMIVAAKFGLPIYVEVFTRDFAVVLFKGFCRLDKDFDAPLEGSAEYSFSAQPSFKNASAPIIG